MAVVVGVRMVVVAGVRVCRLGGVGDCSVALEATGAISCGVERRAGGSGTKDRRAIWMAGERVDGCMDGDAKRG